MKWSQFFSGFSQIPPEWRQDFQSEWTYITYSRARVVAWVMLILPLMILPAMLNAQKSAKPLQFMMMVSLMVGICLLSGVILFGCKIAHSPQEIRKQHHYITSIYLASLVFLFNSAFAVMWSSMGINSPFLIGIFAHTSMFYYPSRINLLLYILNFIFYISFVSAFDFPEIVKLSAYIGGLLSTTIAWVISTILFDSKLRDFINNRTIEQQSASLQAANEQLHILASQDGLTKIPNRRRFDQHLEQQWKQLGRSKAFLTLLLCDIDHFKLYNDTYGHQAGDNCLKQVATAIAQIVQREGDLVARYGGEEFVVILPNTFGEAAIALAERVCQQVRQLQIPHSRSQTNFVTTSIGVSWVIPIVNIRPEQLIAAADRALYCAKQTGRDRVVYLDMEIDVETKEHPLIQSNSRLQEESSTKL